MENGKNLMHKNSRMLARRGLSLFRRRLDAHQGGIETTLQKTSDLAKIKKKTLLTSCFCSKPNKVMWWWNTTEIPRDKEIPGKEHLLWMSTAAVVIFSSSRFVSGENNYCFYWITTIAYTATLWRRYADDSHFFFAAFQKNTSDLLH